MKYRGDIRSLASDQSKLTGCPALIQPSFNEQIEKTYELTLPGTITIKLALNVAALSR